MRAPADTLAAPLLAVDRFLQRPLAGDDARRRTYATAAKVPQVSGAVLECHLGDPGRLDLSVRQRPSEIGCAAATPEQSAWWTFDGDAFAGVYLGAGKKATDRPGPARLERWLDGLDELARERGARVPAASRAGLASLLERLGGEQPMTYLGVLPRRDPGVVRVAFDDVPAGELRGWLETAGWPGDLAGVERVVAGGAAASRPLSVHLEVAETVRGTLGLELRPLTWSWASLLLAALPRRLRPLAPAIEAWRGFERLDESWPEALRSRWAAAARRVNHLKWAFRPGAEPALKAYLYLGLIRSEEMSR